MSEPRPKWRPTHCKRGEAPLPVMLITDTDGTAVFHDGFAPAAKLLSDVFHRLYVPVVEYAASQSRKKAQRKAERQMGEFKRWTEAEIDAAASPAGGYGRAEYAKLGITYPPKSGWRQALLAGTDPNNPLKRKKVEVEGDTELLELVVTEIIEQGQAKLIEHIPGLLDRFGARLPTAKELANRRKKPMQDMDFFV
jgi:hypothetical protein